MCTTIISQQFLEKAVILKSSKFGRRYVLPQDTLMETLKFHSTKANNLQNLLRPCYFDCTQKVKMGSVTDLKNIYYDTSQNF